MKKSLVLLVLILSITIVHAQNYFLVPGVMDLKEYDFQNQGPLALHGEWEFYMSQLLSPEDLKNDNLIKDYITFPDTWNDLSKSNKPGNGFATYRLKILLRSPQSLALQLPQMYSSYTLWINEDSVTANGTVGNKPEHSKPQWVPQTIVYTATQDTLNIVLQISNFHHAKGGIREEILLGSDKVMLQKRAWAVGSNIALMVILFVLGLLFLGIYFFLKKEVAALAFSALCLTWGLREGFSNLYIVNSYFPDFPWDLAVRIEYITLYLTMIWTAIFISAVFHHDISKPFQYLFISFNILFTGLTVFLSPCTFTQFLPVYLSFAAVLILYVIYVLLHAVMYEKRGVWFIVGCFLVGVMVFAFDLASYQFFSKFNAILVNFGYVLMFLLLATGLSIKLHLINKAGANRDVLTFEDLYGKS